MSSIPPSASPYLLGSEDVPSFDWRAYCLDADPAIQLQFRSVSVTLGQLQCLPGSPHDEASAAQLLETQVHPNDASQFSPPEILFTDAQEAEPPGHGSASGSGQYSCERCGKPFKRLQEHERHVREVHGLRLPLQCPFCPYQWKRPYKIKDHLIKVHDNELTAVLEGVRILRGQDVVEFVETLKFVRHFKSKTPETDASSSPFPADGRYFIGSIGVVLSEDVDKGRIEEMTERPEDM